jgi:hypothetical protein
VSERSAVAGDGHQRTAATISYWEHGQRGVDHFSLEWLDGCYKAGGALMDMARATGSPGGLDARMTWWHNFTGPNGPVWAWLRPGTGQSVLGAHLFWGPARVEFTRRCGAEGVIVVAPASIPNPPVRVELDAAGWADFGCGHVPKELGIMRLHAIVRARPYKARSNITNVDTEEVRKFGIARRPQLTEVLELFHSVDDPAQKQVRTPTFSDLTANDDRSAGEENVELRGDMYRRLRKARGLSQPDAATLVTALLPEFPAVDYRKIDRLEHGGNPGVERLTSRLDTVYSADGHLCHEAVTHSLREPRREWQATFAPDWCGAMISNAFTVTFPRYWVGPIWIRFKSPAPSDVANVLLRWEPWQKPVRVRSGTTITTRCSGTSDPLVVDVPLGWTIEAGLGVDRFAVDVQEGWSAIDESAAKKIFEQMRSVFESVFGTTAADVRRAVRRVTK